jgi:metallo-beta-lactamase family protein
MATITFHGAAREVTGSCHLLESPALGRVLLDCGMRQGGDAVERMQDERFAFDPASIDAVVLSHAHLDHSGMLPRLVPGRLQRSHPLQPVPRVELLDIMLRDAAGLYLRDLERENRRRNKRRGRAGARPGVHAWKMSNARPRRLPRRGLRRCVSLGSAGTLRFHDAGHILGSAIVEIVFEDDGREKTLVFSGDLGKEDSVLMLPPTRLEKADIVLMESTYGDREHKGEADTLSELRDVLRDTWRRGGNVMIPSFAVERTQELLFHLALLYQRGELDAWRVFLDSPMAIDVTRVYDRWLSLLDQKDVQALGKLPRGSLETALPMLTLTPETDQSMAINRIQSGAIIIAGSGMCTGGRIRHHFKQRIWDANNTILFVGFQAAGTLGRLLVDGMHRIRLFREDYEVKAQIETLGGLSAHAGQRGLIAWVSAFTTAPKVVLVHGEPRAQDALAERLQQELGREVEVPSRGDSLSF